LSTDSNSTNLAKVTMIVWSQEISINHIEANRWTSRKTSLEFVQCMDNNLTPELKPGLAGSGCFICSIVLLAHVVIVFILLYNTLYILYLSIN
jgi:hypothetical protein